MDKYPTFTLCFQGDEFYWYHDENIFDRYSLNASQYQLLLKGELAIMNDLNKTSKVYDQKQVLLTNDSNENIDRFHLRAEDFLNELRYLTEDGTNSFHFVKDKGSNKTPEAYIHLSYQTADKICFTRNSNDALKSIRLHDLITFKSSIIENKMYEDTEVQVFIHSPNQLTRSFDKPNCKASFTYFIRKLTKRNRPGTKHAFNILQFQISQVKQLRRRPDSNVPCNDIADYDKYYQQQIAKELECIPPYWKEPFPNSGPLEYCTSLQKLQDAFRKTNDPQTIHVLNEFPCDQMKLLSIASINNEPSPTPTEISMQFFYNEKTYDEIRYDKMMGFESWLSNVGGFIGIFLGYSLMQIPEFLFYVIAIFCKAKDNLIKCK